MEVTNGSESSHHVTFSVNGTLFALENNDFREIRFMRSLKEAPHMPDYMVGTINLRQVQVPVVDVRKKFGMTEGETTAETCIILAERKHGEQRYLLGLLSDTLPDVIGFDPDTIASPHDEETPVNRDYIKGIGKIEEESVVILDFDRIFSSDELHRMFSVEVEETDGKKPAAAGRVA